jgi:hypothetical protein
MAPLQCHFCGAPVTVGEPIPRDAECDSCRRDLRCCVNCRHYDTRYNNACTEPMADPVTDKDRRNFCEYFYFNREPFAARAASPAKADAARAKLDALFGKPGDPPTEDRGADARRKLDALFGSKPKDREGPGNKE